MKKSQRLTGFRFHAIMLGVMLAITVAGCGTPTATIDTNTVAETSAFSTILPSATIGASETPTVSPTSTITPTLAIPVAQKTSVPTPEGPFQNVNSQSVIELARWGMGKINHIEMTPDRKYLAAATATGTYIYDPINLQEVAKFGREGQSAEYVSFSPDGKFAAVAIDSRKVDVFRVEDFTYMFTIGDEFGGFRNGTTPRPFFAFTPDSKQLALVGYDQESVIFVHDLPDGKKIRTIKVSESFDIPDIRSIYYSRANGTLIVEGYGGFILLNGQDDTLVTKISITDVRDFTLSDDGSILILQIPDLTRIYETKTGKQFGTIKPTDYKLDTSVYSQPEFRSVRISPNGKVAAFLMSDLQICMWSIDENKPLNCVKRPDNDAYHIMRFSPDGTSLFASSYGSIDQWDTSTWEKINEKMIKYETGDFFFSNDPDSILTLQYSSYASGRMEVINRWGFEDKARLTIKNGDPLHDVQYSPNGKYLAGLGESKAYVWNPEKGDLVTTIDGKAESANTSYDGKTLALGMADRTVQFISLPDGKQISSVTNLTDPVSNIFFTGDNSKVTLISGNKVLVTNISDGKILATIETNSPPILAWPANGMVLIVESDLTTTLWEEKTTKLLETFKTLIGKVNDPITMEVSQNGVALLGADSFNLVTLGLRGNVIYSNKINTGKNPNLRLNASGLVAAVNTNEGIQIYDLNSQSPLNTMKKDFSTFDITPSGSEIAGITNDGVEIYPLSSLPTHSVIGSAMTVGQPYFLLASNQSSLFSKQAKDAADVILVEGMGSGMKWIDPSTGNLIGLSQTKMENFIISASPDRKLMVMGANNQMNEFEMRLEDIEKMKYLSENPVPTQTSDAKKKDESIVFESFGSEFFMSNTISISNTGIMAASMHSNKLDIVGLWSTQSGKLLAKLKTNSRTAAISQDGKLVAVTETDNKHKQHVKVFSIKNLPSFSEIADIPLEKITIPRNIYFETSRMAFSADGSVLALGSTGGEIALINTQKWDQVNTLEGHSNSITGLIFPAEGDYLYSTSLDGTTRMWGVSSRSDLILKNDPIPSSDPQKNNQIFEVKVESSNLLKLDTTSIPQIKEVKRWQVGKYDAETTTCTGCVDGIWTFEKEDLEVYLSFYEPGNTFRTIKPYLNDEFSKDILSFEKVADVSALSNDGKILARGVSVKDGIEILDTNGNLQQKLTGLTLDYIIYMSFSPDNKYLAVTTGDTKKFEKSEFMVWDITTKPAKLTSRKIINGYIGSLIYKPEVIDGYELFAGVWESTSGSPLLHIDLSSDGKIENISNVKVDSSSRSFRMAISPEGNFLALDGDASKILFFDLNSQSSVGEIPAEKIMKRGKLEVNYINYMAFMPDMKGLMVSYEDGSLRLYGVTK